MDNFVFSEPFVILIWGCTLLLGAMRLRLRKQTRVSTEITDAAPRPASVMAVNMTATERVSA